MTQRVNVLCVRTADGQIAPLPVSNSTFVKFLIMPCLSSSVRKPGCHFWRATFPSPDEFFVTRYEAIGNVREFAEQHNLQLWLDPQCDFNGNLIPESGIKGDPNRIASIVLKR